MKTTDVWPNGEVRRGIASGHRARVWLQMSGAAQKRLENETLYAEYCSRAQELEKEVRT